MALFDGAKHLRHVLPRLDPIRQRLQPGLARKKKQESRNRREARFALAREAERLTTLRRGRIRTTKLDFSEQAYTCAHCGSTMGRNDDATANIHIRPGSFEWMGSGPGPRANGTQNPGLPSQTAGSALRHGARLHHHEESCATVPEAANSPGTLPGTLAHNSLWFTSGASSTTGRSAKPFCAPAAPAKLAVTKCTNIRNPNSSPF